MSSHVLSSISYTHHYLAGCHRPPPLPFAILDGSPDEETLVTKTRRYYCEPGYVETGPVAVRCNDDLTWITSLDRCKGGSLWKKVYTMSIVILVINYLSQMHHAIAKIISSMFSLILFF